VTRSSELRRHYRVVHVYICIALALYVLGTVWNYCLFNLGGFYGDWLVLGRWQVCIGDLFYLFGFAVALSIPLRYEDMK
jgi:hypothetical protein